MMVETLMNIFAVIMAGSFALTFALLPVILIVRIWQEIKNKND